MEDSTKKGGIKMDGKLNINFQVNNDRNEAEEACKIDIYFNCLNEKTFNKIKGTLKDSCNTFGNLISNNEEVF